MPKAGQGLKEKLQKNVKAFGEDIFSTDGSILFCKICSKSINSSKKYFVDSHINSAGHLNRLENLQKSKQQLLSTIRDSCKKSEFNFDLCHALTAASIPLWKLENQTFKSFLTKYMNRAIPSESTIRKGYMKDVYEASLERIRAATANKKIWLSIDETTDIGGRYVANAIVGVLSDNESTNYIFLLNCQFLEKTNATTIARFFDDSVKLLSENFDRDNVLLFVTDAAPYMIKAAAGIQILYPKLIHVTCVAHGLHRVAEQIRGIYPQVDCFVGNLKKIFLKAPGRVAVFKSIAPYLALPPKPILTRWGTWITAVEYASKNHEVLKTFLNSIDDDAVSVSKCREIINSSEFQNEIAFISCNYGFLPNIIEKLQAQNIAIQETLAQVELVREIIAKVPGSQASIIKTKFIKVFEKNKGLEIIKKIVGILSGDSTQVVSFTPEEVACFKHAPLTSCDVERSFSKYKNLVTDKRLNLSELSIKHHIIACCNNVV